MAQTVDKQIEKLRATVESGAAYEAQQILKTVFHRYRSRKKLQDSYDLAERGAILQLEHGQVTCGLELGLLLIEVYGTDEVVPVTAAVARVLHILEALKQCSTPDARGPNPSSGAHAASDGAPDPNPAIDSAAAQIALSAIKWARATPGAADPIHAAYAAWVFARGGPAALATATPHYVKGGDVAGLAAALRKAAADAPEEELDLFVTRATLQMLVVSPPASVQRTIQQARELQTLMYGANGVAVDKPGPQKPLLRNFTAFLLQAIERHSLPLEQLLRQVYAKPLSGDPVMGAALERIETLYLGRRPPPGGMADMLQGLMGMLGSGQDM